MTSNKKVDKSFARRAMTSTHYTLPVTHNKQFLKSQMCLYINIYIYIYISTHTKLTYFDHPNKNVEHPNLRNKRIYVKKIIVMLLQQHFQNNFTRNLM